ncbi:MAG: sarcosine oxidase subunit gamma SoxG [Pseudomonadota bacterium]
MQEIIRVSPVVFNRTPKKTEKRDHWNVVLEYSDEGSGPWLVDLSHRPRFDLQSTDLKSLQPFGMTVPESPGRSLLRNGMLANRMNRTQVSLYSLGGCEVVPMPSGPGFTDVTEATLCVAMIGKPVFSICEKLSALDFMDPGKQPPFLFQGPFSHVPCQIATLGRDGNMAGLVMTCSRGYGRDMIHTLLAAGREFGLEPAGEIRALDWIEALQTRVVD